ncbi:type IV pilus assembly protein PilY1 [Dyella jiangningensis]|uniref:pilus assembly protein n=2 Tax=Gammaproteobacteria TaxID=1236 RepID=UPI00088A535C|nr:PilC/PilY family type IV pilus protein [Dyella sp. AtDHG13]PXV54064.1 type IV pilus assembly protein PilY1 [Dyella sp. AtDHG13]SDL09353.1 type IV pilus assembly protein PilY1 [Dyella jiangningensis]
MKNHFRLRTRAGRFLGRLISSSLTVLAVGVISTPSMADVVVDQQPLIIQRSLPPNIVLMLDDSGSMDNDFMPDTLSDSSANGFRNATVNGTYYNPAVTYKPPPMADGKSSYPTPTDISAAYRDGFRDRRTVDVTGFSDTQAYYTQLSATDTYTATPTCPSTYNWNGSTCVNNRNQTADPTRWSCKSGDGNPDANHVCSTTTKKSYFTYTTLDKGAYTQHYVGKDGDCAKLSTSSNRAACDDSVDTRINVATWFSYYRTRMLMAKSGVMNSFSGLDPTFRVGFGSIDGGNVDGLGTGYYPFSTTVTRGRTTTTYKSGLARVKPFGDGASGTQKAKFWAWLEGGVASGYTPLQQALDFVGQYYQTDDPWASMSSDPDFDTAAASAELACRQSYTILTTDGFWNGDNPSTKIGNADNTSAKRTGPNDQTFVYTPAAPFSDSYSLTLADVAHYYWINDLRPNTANQVPTNKEDPAFWQHMTTFTLGMGFAPTNIKPATATYDDIMAWSRGGTAIANFSWPQPSSDSENNIADLAHAAINGRGGFYSATTPQAFTDGLKDALKRATSRVGTGASLAANSTQLQTGTMAYQANYYTASWKGDLKALAINADTGAIATNPAWTASAVLPAYGSRKVYTYNASAASSAASVFQFNAANLNLLSGAQQKALGDTAAEQQAVISYLLGDNSNEQDKKGGRFRKRDTPLGDIVNSQPVYVGQPNANQFVGKNFNGASTFADYAAKNAKRTGRILVAANDGLLHAFNAGDGVEAYAYLPSAVITSDLKRLSSPDYGGDSLPHQYFNDGELTVADVYYGPKGSESWHTVAVGTTGRGPARAVYAIDVTDPASFKFLWERSAGDGLANSDYIGQMAGKPVIAQTANGSWSVLIGNGYNSSQGTAALLQFAIADGTLNVHATTDVGKGNGLAAPAVWIGDSANGISTLAYAGDASGQVWKFVLNDGGVATPDSTGSFVFQARNDDKVAQPITAGMLMGRDPATGNLWLFFGTGKYLTSSDLKSKATQTWYGIIVGSPSNSTIVAKLATDGRAALVKRQILIETAGDAKADPPVQAGRGITATPAVSDMGTSSGWYIDLISPVNGAEGERMVTSNGFQGSMLWGTTRIPQAVDACNPSGRGWVMPIRPFTGTAGTTSFFDLNGDGVIDSNDNVSSDGQTSINSGVGFGSLPNNPIFVGGVMLISFDNGSTRSIQTAGSQGEITRVSWREMVNP